MPLTEGKLLGVKSVRRSVVDVGTNSVKLLVADVHGQEVRPVFETSQQTRLGEGFYTSHVLQEGPISQTAKAVAAFAVKAAEMGAEPPRVVATSAARDAKNQTDLTSAIEKASGLRVQIISGDEEATYGFLGVMSDPSLAREPLLLLDVGGGSSEFILGHHDQKPFTQSFALGTVRLLEEVACRSSRGKSVGGVSTPFETFPGKRDYSTGDPSRSGENRFFVGLISLSFSWDWRHGEHPGLHGSQTNHF